MLVTNITSVSIWKYYLDCVLNLREKKCVLCVPTCIYLINRCEDTLYNKMTFNSALWGNSSWSECCNGKRHNLSGKWYIKHTICWPNINIFTQIHHIFVMYSVYFSLCFFYFILFTWLLKQIQQQLNMLKKSTQECGVEIEKTRQMQEHHSINFYKHHQISGIGIGMGNGIGIDIFMGYIGCITLSTSTNTIRSQVLVLVLLLSRVSCWLHHVMMVVSLNQLLETRKIIRYWESYF